MTAITRHAFVPERRRDGYGRRICADCGSIEKSRVHVVLPERSDEEKALEARILGEEA